MNWKKNFTNTILERGYDYYIDDRVDIITQSNDYVSANVYGYDEYEVEITFENNEIYEMNCTCPYAENGNNCKHMAAVFYEIENEEIQCIDNCNEDIDEILKLVDEQDLETLKKFTKEVLKENKYINQFKLMIHQPLNHKNMNVYENLLRNIKKEYFNKYSYEIDFYELCNDLNDFIENIKELIKYHEYKNASILLSKVFSIINDIEEYSDDINEVINNILECYEEMLINNNCKDLIFEHLFEMLGCDYNKIDILNLLCKYYHEDNYKNKLLNTYKNKIDLNNASYWTQVHIEDYLFIYMKYHDLNNTYHECKKYWKYPKIRQLYINICIENKEYDQAIQVLLECIEMDHKEYNVRNYYVQLKDLCKQLNRKEQYIDYLWDLNYFYFNGDMELYHELKNLYSKEEWEKEKVSLIHQLKDHENIDLIYKEENMIDDLYEYVISKDSFYSLQKYEDLFIDKHSDKCIEIYREYIFNQLKNSSSRNHYREICGTINRIVKFNHGKDDKNEIVNKLLLIYPTRRALKEELNRLCK